MGDLAYKFGTDKSKDDHNYVTTYQMVLAPIKEQIRSMVEIGVKTGQSEQMWASWLPNTKVIGIDIAIIDIAKNNVKAFPNVHLLEGSSQDNASVAKFGLEP